MAYFEIRTQSARGTDSMAADIMRHLRARQYLGKALIITNQSVALLSASRKQWLKLGRILQKQRAGTLNADKILKYTHTIAHMQHMVFTHKTPLHEPEADIYFLEPHELQDIPTSCYSMYLTVMLPQTAQATLRQLPADALLVDYADTAETWQIMGFSPKHGLELRVEQTWQELCTYVASRGIQVTRLIDDSTANLDMRENALDILLDAPTQFLAFADAFQRALELARPLRLSKSVRQHYDALVLLSHHVQALSPGVFSKRFLEAYNEDDSFFFYDTGHAHIVGSGESLASTVARHRAAGRHRLASALYYYATARHGTRTGSARTPSS